MHEVINLSCSHSAGHLLTQLYNVQESHIPYSKAAKLNHDNDVFLTSTRVNGRANYHPRSINFEFSGGYGFLSKFEYSESKVKVEDFDNVLAQERLTKNEYQATLDSSGKTTAAMLNTDNTSHWTDYNRLIYKPKSLMELPNYKHPDGQHKHFPRLKFDSYTIGQEEFIPLRDEIDDGFRKFLETLDQIQGVSFFTETDSAWGGFTNEMIMFLRDEYFNGGNKSKYNFWTYGLQSLSKPSTLNMLNRIKATSEFATNCTLFIPMNTPTQSSGFFNDTYNPTNLWHREAVNALFVNSLWGLNSQLEYQANMATLEDSLLRTNHNRNIVNELRICQKNQEDFFGLVQNVDIMAMYYSGAAAAKSSSELSLGHDEWSSGEAFSRISIGSKEPEQESTRNTTFFQNHFIDEITSLDTFPQILKQGGGFSTDFQQTGAYKQTLKNYKKVIEKVKLPQHLEIIGDKAELIESISLLVEEYSCGYSDESDYE